MADAGFVHLHTHSEFSLLDGAIRLKRLVERAAQMGMPALALTDHGTMYGAVPFYLECKRVGIKPILGVEAYITHGDHRDRTPRSGRNHYHLLLLARNLAGYRNLLRLSTSAMLDGFYYKPRIDRELLERHCEGLIATSGCLSGEVADALKAGDYRTALERAAYYRDLLGRDHYFIELQDHGLPDQSRNNPQLLRIARDLGLSPICSNDVHYLERDDAFAHEVLLCIGTGSTIDTPDHMRYDAQEFYLKSAEEMRLLFPDVPEAIEGTLQVADLCDLDLTATFGRAPLPAAGIPDGYTAQTYLRALAEEGMRSKVAADAPRPYRERLDYELGIIEQTGFAQYILIVRDFALFARRRGIYFGVRGSAAGSLVSYCIDITDIDPVDYDLTFERFLNPERVQMPDIDMDFEDSRRGEVIEYVTQKYGPEHVAQIVTFGTLMARAAIKDTGRALSVPIPEVNRVVGMVPTAPLNVSIGKSLEMNPDLLRAYNESEQVRKLIDTARRLEGVSRHSSVHAAGVVISHEPLVEYTPLQRSADGGLVTQYPASALEKIGLLKMDFLGLINLSILGRALENIKRARGTDIDVRTVPLDDERTFELLSRGDTTGIFQLESDGMRRYVKQLRPNSVRDLAAMVALYRPGPMNHIPAYIRGKHGLDAIRYPHPLLEEVLRETHGVIVYQDQVLRIVQVIAGFSLGQADLLRRAMGKKDAKEMAQQRVRFVEGAAAKGIAEKKANELFDLIEPFAGYAFNKAHAVCYAMVAYQTAYLKANYPVEYMAALLACYMEKTEKVASCLTECRRMHIEVLPPDVNRSDVDFLPEGDSIRFGLAGIRNVGRGAVEAILAARADGGPFLSLPDLCTRVAAHSAVTRSTLEALVLCGALSSLHPCRRALQQALEGAMHNAARHQRDREKGQVSLFGAEGGMPEVTPAPIPDVPEHTYDQLLAYEKELLGLYISDHPLDRHAEALRTRVKHDVSQLQEMDEKAGVLIGGIITSVKPFRSKKTGEPMAFLTLEDLTGPVSVTVFPSTFRECASAIDKDRIVIVRGRISCRDRVRDAEEGARSIEVLAESVEALAAAGSRCSALHIRIGEAQRGMLRIVRSALEGERGNAPVFLHVEGGPVRRQVRARLTVEPGDGLLARLRQLIGGQAVWVD